MNPFVASMLILVFRGNMLVTFVGSKGENLLPSADRVLVHPGPGASAGQKTFIYNQIGDVGFFLATDLTFERVHSLEHITILANLGKIGSANVAAMFLLLLPGVIGKSAQIPPFPWLADAQRVRPRVLALIQES